jgi:hypothetical protein
MLPSDHGDDVGTPNALITRLNSLACTCRYRRFACALADADARLTATVGRYPFDVELFHLLLHAGFDPGAPPCRLIPAHPKSGQTGLYLVE